MRPCKPPVAVLTGADCDPKLATEGPGASRSGEPGQEADRDDEESAATSLNDCADPGALRRCGSPASRLRGRAGGGPAAAPGSPGAGRFDPSFLPSRSGGMGTRHLPARGVSRYLTSRRPRRYALDFRSRSRLSASLGRVVADLTGCPRGPGRVHRRERDPGGDQGRETGAAAEIRRRWARVPAAGRRAAALVDGALVWPAARWGPSTLEPRLRRPRSAGRDQRSLGSQPDRRWQIVVFAKSACGAGGVLGTMPRARFGAARVDLSPTCSTPDPELGRRKVLGSTPSTRAARCTCSTGG